MSEMGESSISFDVDQTGVPVLVKVSYFPNWEASGADGPYRIGPNMMVVIPTENHVELEYGRTPIDYLSILLTFVGIGLCFWWRREGDIVHAGPTPDVRPSSMTSTTSATTSTTASTTTSRTTSNPSRSLGS